MPVVPVPGKPDPAVLPDPTALSCVMCGTALTAGKRFCRQCGHAIDSPSLATPVEASPTGGGGASVKDSKVLDLPPAVPVDAPPGMLVPAMDEPSSIMASPEMALEPAASLHTQNGPATPWTSAWETVEEESPDSSLTTLISRASVLPPVPRGGSRQKIGIAISIAASVLVMAGVWAYYAHAHRGVSSMAKSASESQLATAPLPEQSAKPSASIPATHAPSMPQPKSGTSITSATLPPKLPQDSGQHPAKKTQQPEPESLALHLPQPAVPAAARSGILHYQGPPVPYNGVVVFDHLPQARLKFNFDRQAWTVTIKPNPDGTKRVTLISQKQGYQTNCDLSWEIVE